MTNEDFPNIYLLIGILQILPPTTVSCESSFSQMKLLKTSRRLGLQPDVLNSMMTVKIVSLPVETEEFDPEEAIIKMAGNYMNLCN